MSNQGGWSRCPGDGRPVHPGDQAIIGMFGAWLDMTDDQQARALRVSPGWRKLLRGEPLDAADIAGAMSADVAGNGPGRQQDGSGSRGVSGYEL